MKATELRIGNYILISVLSGDKFVNELFAVNATTIRDAEHYGNEWNAEPIPLTEEWLLKFGFEFYEGKRTIFNDSYERNNVRLNYREDKKIFYWEDRHYMELKYVHQLQNLYFALTGNELEIK